MLAPAGWRGALLAEAHARIAAPLYALVAMAMALAAIMGGSFSRTGYSLRIAKAAGVFLLVRVIGYGLVAASAWNPWMNILQYLAPLIVVAAAVRLLFRALKPRKRRKSPVIDRLRARFA